MPPARLQRLLAIPLIGCLVRRKILKVLGLDQCRMAVGGAAPMPVALLEWFAYLGLPINEGYGMTENLAISHLTIPGQNQRGSVGPHEQLACLVLLMTPWTVDNHMITPTFKVRRNSIETLFAARYASWEGMKTKVIWGD